MVCRFHLILTIHQDKLLECHLSSTKQPSKVTLHNFLLTLQVIGKVASFIRKSMGFSGNVWLHRLEDRKLGLTVVGCDGIYKICSTLQQ